MHCCQDKLSGERFPRAPGFLSVFLGPKKLTQPKFLSWSDFFLFLLSLLPFNSQNNASKLLLAIMESRHDSENAERILYNMRPKELVRKPG